MDEELLAAIAAKNLPRVEELLAAGANPNTRRGDRTAYQLVPHSADEIKCALIEAGADDPELKHALVWVTCTGRVEAVRVLIEKCSDVNVATPLGTPIQVAVGGGHAEIVELLLAAGADVDASSSISTPLIDAIERGYTGIVLQLISAGADPDRTPTFGNTPPLAFAVAQKSPEVIQALIKAGANVNVRVPQMVLNRQQIQQEAASALQAAFGAMETAEGIMASLEAIDEDHETDGDRLAEIPGEIEPFQPESAPQPETAIDTFPVIIAARCGRAEALDILLVAGANPHCKDGEGLSAFDWARQNQNRQVLAVLQRFGVSQTRVNADEQLLLAAENGDLAAVRESFAAGANIDARDVRQKTRDRTPLMLAATAGHTDVVRALLAAGADLDVSDRRADTDPVPKVLLQHTDVETILSMGYRLGRTALMGAAEVGNSEIVEILLQAKAESDRADDLGYTALTLAVENEQPASVDVLLQAGADIHYATVSGDTPLILACEKGATNIAELLLARGANPNETNRDRETPLMKAAETGRLDLVRLLVEQGADVNAISRNRTSAIALASGAMHRVQIPRNAPRNPNSISREYGDDGCWELRVLPEEQILAIVRALVQAGADVNPPNSETLPLLEAARNGYVQLLQFLLASGANLEARDRDGDTAISLAKLYNRQSVLAFLRDYTGTDLSEFEAEEEEEDGEEESDRWGEELRQPDFSEAAQNPSYQQAVEDLGKICGSTPTSYGTTPGWFSVHVNSKRSREINTEELQRQFLERGCFVYEPGSHSGGEPEKLCILPTTDKYDAIALHQTNGANCGIGLGYVVQWLKKLEAEQPFVLTCIAHDTLAGRFLTAIANPEELADRMYDFCPDIVEQGCEEVELLAESLAANDGLFFWWD